MGWGRATSFPGLRERIERLKFTFTPNRKREFVARDQVFPYFPFTVYYFYTKISSFIPVLSLRIFLDCFLSAYFLFWEILNLNLTFTVYLSDIKRQTGPYGKAMNKWTEE